MLAIDRHINANQYFKCLIYIQRSTVTLNTGQIHSVAVIPLIDPKLSKQFISKTKNVIVFSL